MTNPLLQDYIYFAGLFDGEGCISKNSALKQVIYLQIIMVDKIVIDWLFKKFGGSYYLFNRKNRGINEKPTHHWKLTNVDKIIPLLENIIPYLILKKNRAILALQLCYLVQKSKHSFGIKISQEEYELRSEIIKKIKMENQRLQKIEVDLSEYFS